MTNNLQQTSTPPRASFASALAQNPVPTAPLKQSSPAKAVTVPAAASVASAAAVDVARVEQSPVVKLPASAAGNNGISPVITIDGSKAVQSTPSAKVNSIKFGSFAAAAASMSSQNETVSVAASSNSQPSLPPRTQSAPPSVIVQDKASVVAAVSVPAKEEIVVLEPAVVLPVIQEDASSVQHVQPQASFSYEQSHQYQHQQQYSHYQQQQYQQRPPRYNNYGGQQRYYNPQHQQGQGGYIPQQYQQQPQFQQNPNYRPHQNPNYRPRPQYHQQGGYYPPQGMPQGGYYPAPQQMHQGYYRPPPSQQEQMAAGPTAAPFQRPAPAFNNYARPAVAPVVPANLPTFSSAAAPAPVVESVAVAPVATAPAFVKPAPSKIKIVDPVTGKELSFGSKPAVVAAEVVEQAPKKEEPVQIEKIAEPVTKTVEPIKASEPAVKPAVEAVKPAPVASMPSTPVKKISIVIKDPNSHKELDLSQVVARPAVKEDLAVEELTAAFAQSTKLEEENLSESPVIMPSESPAPVIAAFEHDKTILANLNVDDDELSLDEDDDFTDYSSDEEDEEEVFIPSTVQFNQSIVYPAGAIPFKAPADATGPWLYSSEFLLQFRDKCTTTPGDLQERLSAAVEKAKAFANSERMNGDRSDRRDGGRDDRKKRRNNNGALGPQAHLLDMGAVLKNRAEKAWAPVRSAEELSQVERILREVKGLLNKLTLEKFHVISDKILSMGIMSPDVLSGVIDSVFDKSVSEPGFAPMYAELCYKIVVEELNGLKKTLPANAAPDSQFRRLLVERCQAEYKHKRAWSKKRLEKLLESPSDKQENGEESAAASPVIIESAAAVEATPKSNVGQLTEEDYLLIKLKRRVLGNMRFIGEIFKVGLIGEKIMHSIITELLSNVENPEEEEIECLCRLLMTVGSILDKPEAANFWNQYVGRMNWLISQSDKLSSRVRFLVMDTLELRDKKWRTGKSAEGPKTISQIEKEQHKEREKDRDHRDKGRHGNAPPPMKFSSNKQQQQQQPAHPQQQRAEEWNRSGPSNKSSTGAHFNRAPPPAIRRPQTPQATPELSPVSPSVGRFGVLEVDVSEPIAVPVKEAEAVAVAVASSGESDAERIKKIVSLLGELVQMNNYEDVYEELKACSTSSAKSSALSGLLNRAIESGKKPSLLAVIKIFTDCPAIDRPIQLEACKKSFGMIDDLAVDVPSIYESAGQLSAALNFSLPEIFETLSDCSDDMAKTRVILQTVAAISDPAAKSQILKDAKEFVDKNKKPAIENLIKKLNIEI